MDGNINERLIKSNNINDDGMGGGPGCFAVFSGGTLGVPSQIQSDFAYFLFTCSQDDHQPSCHLLRWAKIFFFSNLYFLRMKPRVILKTIYYLLQGDIIIIIITVNISVIYILKQISDYVN